MWIVLVVLLVLLYLDPPVVIDKWNMVVIACIVFILASMNIFLGLIAAVIFAYKLSKTETRAVKALRPRQTDILALDESLRPKDSSTLL